MSRKGQKLTVERLKSRIVEVQYEDREVLGQRMVTANFKMDNGFIVYGKNPSTSIDPARFDIELGKKLAYEKTLEQLWELETYRALSESMLFEVACGIEIDVFKYRVESSERFAVPHEMSEAFAVNVVFQAPGLDGHCKPMKYVATLIQPTEHLSFEDHNAKVLDKVRDYLIKNIPLEHMYPQLVVRMAKVAFTAQYVYSSSEIDGNAAPWEALSEEHRRVFCEHVVDILRGVEGRFPSTLASKIFVAVVNSFK